MTDPSPEIPWYKAYTGTTPQGRLGDGREQQLLTHVRSLCPKTPAQVAAAIDSFGFNSAYLMTIGPRKAALLANLIETRKPTLMLELGGYIGYSAVVLGEAVRKHGGSRYISIESNDLFASIAREFLQMAGLQEFVEVRVGRSDLLLRQLRGELSDGEALGTLFVDHYKPAYLHDLKLAEELGLVGEGTTVVADNVGHPGAPEYKSYVLCTTKEKKQKAEQGGREVNPNAQNWYLGDGERVVDVESVVGRPDLEYQTECLEAFEPDGTPDVITVTKCLG